MVVGTYFHKFQQSDSILLRLAVVVYDSWICNYLWNQCKVVSSNHAHGEVYTIQHYVIKFISDLRQVCGFHVSSTNKTDHYDITKILLKVELNSGPANTEWLRLFTSD
jgi:hypothetical protein